jgi:hypothetical protein
MVIHLFTYGYNLFYMGWFGNKVFYLFIYFSFTFYNNNILQFGNLPFYISCLGNDDKGHN